MNSLRFPSPLSMPRHWRFVTALALAAAACQRREALDTRTPLSLGTPEDWSLATHPSLSMTADDLRSLAVRLFTNTNRFQIVPSDTPGAARAVTRIISVDVEPVAEAPAQTTIRVRARLEYIPPGSDETSAFIAVATGSGRGSREQAEAAACETALTRAVVQIRDELQADTKTASELVADLGSTDPFRVSAALEHLATRRHPAAFDPLLKQLHQPDTDLSLKALSALVSYDDPRAVQPIIDEAEHRDFAFYLEALYAIGSLGGEQAEAYLETIQSGHSDPRAQTAAGEALNLARKRASTAKRLRTDGAVR